MVCGCVVMWVQGRPRTYFNIFSICTPPAHEYESAEGRIEGQDLGTPCEVGGRVLLSKGDPRESETLQRGDFVIQTFELQNTAVHHHLAILHALSGHQHALSASVLQNNTPLRWIPAPKEVGLLQSTAPDPRPQNRPKAHQDMNRCRITT